MKKSADLKPPLKAKTAFNRSVTFHLLIGVFLVVSLVTASQVTPPPGLNIKQADKIVQATAISSQQVAQEVKQIQSEQTAAANAQAAKLAAIQKAAADALAAKQQQAAQLAALKAQQQALRQQAAQQLAALKQQQADAAKQLAATQAAAAKAAQQAAATKAAQQDAAKQLAATKAAQVKAQQQAKLQQAAKLDLAKQMSAEETQLDKQRNQQVNDEISRYTVLILQAISQQWLIPPNVDPTKYCVLEIKLGAGGVVQTVSLQKSSGDDQLDRSAIAAVYKASPLPVPADPQIFAKMQDINLKVRPEDTLTS